MIKNVVAGIAIILALWACVHIYNLDKTVHKTQEIAKLIQKSDIKVHLTSQKEIKKEVASENIGNSSAAKQQDKKLSDKLQALKNKAGNVAAFKVSTLYKKNCSSCHGTIGEGIIGPKIIGRSKDYILKDLKDFKSGKRKNYVMYGLLGNLSDQQLVDLAAEVGSFQAKLDASNN